MGTLYVDQIDPQSGTSLTIGTSGDSVNLNTGVTLGNRLGKIGQVVTTAKTDTTSTTSSSFADISGMTLDITPTATSSKVLIMVQTWVCGGSSANQPINLLRDSTVIGVADTSADYTMPFRQASDGQNQYRMFNLTTTFVDSPSTSSSTTYKLQWKTNSGTLYLNRSVDEGGLGSGVNACSTITALEVLV
tara:strand:- start:903 stop:1472 length:570 start_codon:yes stop_codon:yes gene_type:complete